MALIKDKKKNNVVDSIEKALLKSKTAYSPGKDPTSSDIALQTSLLKAKSTEASAKDQILRDKWYGTDTDEIPDKKPSYLNTFLTTLSAPMSAGAGAVEHALGKGSERTLLGNIKQNVEERGSYGDILRSYNLPNTVSMPVGLALDIFLDPINWATLGTEALIPRIAKGAAAGAKSGVGVVEGVGTAVKSGVLTKAERFMRAIPGTAKRAFGAEAKDSSLYRRLAERADVSRGLYEELIGENIYEAVNKAGNSLMNRSLKKAGEAIRESKVGGFIKDQAYYSPKESYFEMKKLGDEALELSRSMSAKERVAKNVERGVEAFESGGKSPSGAHVAAEMTVLQKSDPAYRNSLSELVDEMKENILTGNAGARFSAMDDAERLAVASSFDALRIGSKPWDKAIGKALTTPVGKKTLDAYSTAISLFKGSKLIPWGTAGTNAVVGNMFMYKMMGGDATPEYFRALLTAKKAMAGDDIAIKTILENNSWVDLLKEQPDMFRQLIGVEPSLLLKGEGFVNTFAKEFSKASGKNADNVDDIIKEVKNLIEETGSIDSKRAESLSKIVSGGKNMAEPNAKAAFQKATKETARKMTSSSETNIDSTLLVREVLRGPYQNFVNKVKIMADNGSPFAKSFHWYLTKPLDTYSNIDQIYRLGTALHFSNNGVSSKELKLLAKRVEMGANDFTKVPNRDAYKLAPERSMEIINTMYMNYLAMPKFAKAMRTLPIVGAPFVSFTYGMTAGLFPQTLAHNPAVINKIQFALKELNGLKSPLEKQGLESKYYNFFDQPGMVKLNASGLFGDNPLYMNMENMIPYYTLLPFQDLNRSYGDRFGGKVAKAIDASPFFKTPEGQWALDYLIFPQVLGEAQGRFGQPLWPADASTGEKIGTSITGAAEPFLPSQLGLTGLVIPGSKYEPYQVRKLAFGKEGKGTTGIQTKTPGTQKVIQALAAMAGLPTYQMKLENIASSNKYKNKKK